MEPGQNVAASQSAAPAPAPAPEPNMMARGVSEKKSGKGMLYGMILLGILAVGGIGFGIWTMMDSNSQKEALNSQISTLKKQNNELSDKIAELESTIEEYKNSENGETGETAAWSAKNAEIIDGAFFIKDSGGEVLAQSEVTAITEIVSCEYLEESTALKCTVTTTDGEGWFEYNTATGILTSSFDSE